MRPADFFDLLPLLLPRERRSLLVVGWHSALASRLGIWERIRVLLHHPQDAGATLPRERSGGIEIVERAEFDSTTTLLVCGVGPQGWKGRLPGLSRYDPASYLVVGPRRRTNSWRKALPQPDWALNGIPLFGRPWVWLPESEAGIDWSVFSPRGRLELPWIRMNRMLARTPLRSRGLTLLASGPSVLREILEVAAPGTTGPGAFWNQTKKNTLVLLTQTDPGLIVKVPLEAEGRDSMRAHQRCVEAFRDSEGQAALLELLPRQTGLVTVGEYTGGVEEAFRGVSAYRYLPHRRRLRAIQKHAAELLANWQELSAEPLRQGPDEFERYWEKPLRPLGRALAGHELSPIYSGCIERLERRVAGGVFPIVPVHGDFWINNLIWDSGRGEVSGILDWDRGAARGLPLLDLFQLLFQRTHYLYSLHSRWSLARTLGRRFPGRSGRIIRAYAARFKLTEEQIEDLYHRYWLGEAASNAAAFMAEREPLRALRLLGDWLRR